MNETIELEETLKDFGTEAAFSKSDLFEAVREKGTETGLSLFFKKFKGLLDEERVVRVGRDTYIVPRYTLTEYKYEHSAEAKKVLSSLTSSYPNMKCCIFELQQYNEFVNHQLAHNTIFLSIGDGLEDYAFEFLRGKKKAVLIRPNLTIYDKYWSDGIIVINKLVREAPLKKGSAEGKIEKILVDTLCDPLLISFLSESEWPVIFQEAFRKYRIDEDTMFRYARRRHCESKLLSFLREKTDVRLWTR